jgi:recombinational DNA repair protein RecR
MSQSIEALENQYFLLRGSLSTLTEQGATTTQLDQLRTQIAQSRTNYWAAVNKNLQDDNPEITHLVTKRRVSKPRSTI